MIFNLFQGSETPEQLSRKALEYARHAQNQARRENMQKRVDFFNGVQKDYLLEELKKQFKNYDRLNLQYEYCNLTEMIITELATIYSEEPSRELIDATDLDNEIYHEIIETTQLNAFMKSVNQFTKLCKTVAVRPAFRGGVIQLDILTPNIFEVIQNPANPTQASAVIYMMGTNDTDPMMNPKWWGNGAQGKSYDPMQMFNQLYFYWDAHRNVYFSYDVKMSKLIPVLREQEHNPDNINPYGVLPFVFMRDKFPTDQFFIEGGDDLVRANEMLNVKLTELNYLTKMQAFSIPVAKGADDKLVFHSDPSQILTIPADTDVRSGADFKFVSPDAKINELVSDIENRLRRVALQHKIPAESFSVSGDKSSGFSIEMQNLQLSKIVRGDKPFYRKFECELFNLIRVVWNYHNPNRKLSDSAKLRVDFAEIETPRTLEEMDAHFSTLYTNGLISRARWLMEINPDIKTVEQSKEYLKEIEDERREESNQKMDSALSMMNFRSQNANQTADRRPNQTAQ